jgi:hypothetical protein
MREGEGVSAGTKAAALGCSTVKSSLVELFDGYSELS